jgi:hypothetical protein
MFKSIAKYLRNNGQFPSRIRKRHEAFWDDPNAESVRNTIMSASDPLEKWADSPNWQRKLSNKFNAREFAKMNGCLVPDLYFKGKDVENIDFNSFPEYYVIRPTIGHSSNQVFLMSKGLNLFDKQEYTNSEIIDILQKSIKDNPEQEFLVEEFLQNEKGEYAIPTDFKFFSFNGEIAFCYVIYRLSPKKGYSNFYDEHWKKMPLLHVSYPLKDKDSPAPLCYPEMVAQAKKLSKAYRIFVRLDFYATPRGPVFGEFTPTPSMGKNFTSFAKGLLISYWNKYCKGMI